MPIEYRVSSGCDYNVSAGETANNVVVSRWGRVFLDGTINGITVSRNGQLFVCCGGTATNIVAQKGALLDFSVDSKTFLKGVSGGKAFELSNGVISGYTFERNCMTREGGMIASSVISKGGHVMIVGKGKAEGVEITSGGWMRIFDGTAEYTTVRSGGSLITMSGCTAKNITADKGAEIGYDIVPGTYVQGTYDGSGFKMASGFVSGYTFPFEVICSVLSGGSVFDSLLQGHLKVCAGGTVSRISVSGRLSIEGDETADRLFISSGGSTRMSGGTAHDTIVSSGGLLEIRDGGIAYDTLVSSTGRVTVFERGTADRITIQKCGDVLVLSDGETSGARISDECGMLAVMGGGIAVDTIVDAGILYVRSGGSASGVIVSSGGTICIESGGNVSDIHTLKGAEIYTGLAHSSFIESYIQLNLDPSIRSFLLENTHSEDKPDNTKANNDTAMIKIGNRGKMGNIVYRRLAEIALKVIQKRVAYYAPIVGVTYGHLTIENVPSRLGFCNYLNGDLNFNYLLAMTSLRVLDSVVVHELCHRIVKGHSSRFYAEVLRVFPEYYECQREYKLHEARIKLFFETLIE